MRGVDLVRTAFDFDLTFAAVLMHPDGHVYHRYGGRDSRGADTWLSLASLEKVLEDSLERHAEYEQAPSPPPKSAPLFTEDVPSFKKRDKGECIHCHTVFPALYEEELEAGTWSEDKRWVHPPPGRIGIDLERDDQTLVNDVRKGSLADAAGLKVGDRLVRAGRTWLSTASDLSQALHDFPASGGRLSLEYERDGESKRLTLALPKEWKRGTPAEFAGRPFKWGFTPAPGFGGQQLDAADLVANGLAKDAFAFRVNYQVTWGQNKRYGHEANRAGIQNGDLVLGAAGKTDFDSIDHFHAWWRLTRAPGTTVLVEVLRDGQKKTLEFKILPS